MLKGLTWLATSIALSFAVSTPALADAINGDWCNGKDTIHIEFPASIRIQSGKDIAGACDRHNCRYTAPAGEKDAGAEVMMHVISDEEMLLMRRVGGTDGPIENWQRCRPVS